METENVDSETDMAVKPQQLIGGINGMILQMHKFHVDLEESKQKNLKQTDKIKVLERKNEEYRHTISELTKAKERYTEQTGFLEKSLSKVKAENARLAEKLKQAEIQLGESGSVLETVRSLESKNEALSAKMSSVLLTTEEEVEKVRAERQHYIKFLGETEELNKRNVEMFCKLSKANEIGDEYAKDAKSFVEKSELYCLEFCKTLEDIVRAKEQATEVTDEKDALATKAKRYKEENTIMRQKNNDLMVKNNELLRNLKEEQKEKDNLHEELKKAEGGKHKLANEVTALKKKVKEAKSNAIEAAHNAKKNKEYESLEQQLRLLVESYTNATQQLGQLKESVDESKGLLKANIEKDGNADEEKGFGKTEFGGHGKIDADQVAVLVEMQDIFQQSEIRNEELATLEKMAGLQTQRFNSDCQLNGDDSGMVSCIRGLVAIKDSQINALMQEGDELRQEITEKKKTEFRLLYQLNELQKENEEILEKMEACQTKYRKLKNEKETIRKNLLAKNAANKITNSYINKLKDENEQHKENLQTQEESLKQQLQVLKDEMKKECDEKNALIEAMKEKIAMYQDERDLVKSELNSRQKKEKAMKEQILSMLGN